MIRAMFLLLALVLAYRPTLSWSAEPNAEEAGAIPQIEKPGENPPKQPTAIEVRKWSDKRLLATLKGQDIVDRTGIDELICCRSAEIKLEVTPIRVWVTDEKRRKARKWISELPEAGPVKMAIGIVESENFLDPKSPPGRLQRMYTDAIPDLIDAALDANLKPGQRAWVLGLLFAITGHNDPRGWMGLEGSEILGDYEAEDVEGGRGSCRGGEINLTKQRAFAEKWRVWKTDHYYVIGDSH